MSRPIYAIFVAGGTGTRMGTSTPKQFLELNGTPVLRRTIERFLDADGSARVITVLPERYIDEWKQICIRGSAAFPQTIVKGGMTRFHSVRNALGKVPDGAIVAIQDGVRPLLSTGLVRNMLSKMDDCKALVPVVPVTDTLRAAGPGIIVPDRSSLRAVQTPQMFWSELLKEAYRQPYDEAFTDDASVAERAGIPISTCPGERFNIKITTPEDLSIASALISAGLV
ncbi:MAG: 2-C-methyl-D-erythritol 4-phosphate cytidylyltransferase [Bacteroidales bacterium]|nr:2-C-methyl-D-erythritol 4-phosphate cytidylyltransferase [Bacteroidales bacterium]